MRLRFIPPLATLCALGVFISGLLSVPNPSAAMPPFAQSYGFQCSVCHTMVPLLNQYGRYVQRSAYSVLDRTTLARSLPFWVGESANYDSSAGAGSGTSRTSFGNLAVHAIGYLTPDVTYHVQQWVRSGNQAGGLDTMWLSYNRLFQRQGHLYVGKILNPAPSPYSQTFDIDGPSASGTVVGEHDWGATYNNRWGSKLTYERNALDIQAGYLLSGDDWGGVNNFKPGDKTFQWKLAFAPVDMPLEVGVFGSNGTIPVSSGTDRYSSHAFYVQLDPRSFFLPGVLAIRQNGADSNPGVDPNTNLVMGATISHGTSTEIFERLLHGAAVLGVRHDISDNGFGTVSTGNSVNLGFNVPYLRYMHGYLESNLGGNSAFAGAGGAPTWKGMLWLTVPTGVRKDKASN